MPLLAAALLACGDPGYGTILPADTGELLTIRNYGFYPQALPVKAGSTVIIRNEDPFPHWVKSQSALGTFTPGAPAGVVPFDTSGAFLAYWPISIAATTPPGTRIPYYCALHLKPEEQGELVVNAP